VPLGLLPLLLVAALPSGRAPLRLELQPCADVDQATIRRVVAMELDAALADEGQSAAVTTAKAECSEGRVSLTIDDPVTGKSSTRTVDLNGQPPAVRSRLLGLAISEAVLASWIELHLAHEQRWSPTMTLATFEARRDAAEIAERRLQSRPPEPASPATDVGAGPSARWFSSGLRMFGAAARVRHWLGAYPSAGVGLDADGGYGTADTPDLAHASAASASLAPALFVRADIARVEVTAAAGWRMGLARLSAEPSSPRRWGGASLRGWGGPFLSVELGVPLSRSVFLHAEVESGYALMAARGRLDSVQVIGLERSWLSTVLSLGTRL
jgi:hypothetical protein